MEEPSPPQEAAFVPHSKEIVPEAIPLAPAGVSPQETIDIEQEVNGLYSYDRKEKIDPAEVKKIMDRAAKMYLDGVAK